MIITQLVTRWSAWTVNRSRGSDSLSSPQVKVINLTLTHLQKEVEAGEALLLGTSAGIAESMVTGKLLSNIVVEPEERFAWQLSLVFVVKGRGSGDALGTQVSREGEWRLLATEWAH